MRKSVSDNYNIFAQAAGKTIHWKVSIKKTASLSELHSEGTWIDVTDYMSKDNLDSINCSTETEDGKIKTDELTLMGLDIAWWKTNIFNATDYLEVKIEFWINNLTADTMVLFSGWIDKLHDVFVVSCNEKKNIVEFKVNSYVEYAERLSAVRLCTQVKNDNIDGAGTSAIMLQKIWGIFVTNANITSYVLKKGIHTLNYDYNGGTKRIQLDGGEWIYLISSNFYILTNADGDQKLEIYALVGLLSAINSSQEIIVTNQGDTLPYTWYNYYFVFYLLKKLFSLIGITNYSFDDFKITTSDGRYTTSFYEIPPGDSFYSVPQVLYWDATNNILWIGVGDKIYKRNMTTHQYTLVGQLPSSSGYSVERFIPDRISQNQIWGIALKWGYYTRIFRITISTGSISAWSLVHHYTTDQIWKLKNITFAPSYGSSGSFFYFDQLGAPYTNFWIFDCAMATESQAYTMSYTVAARVAWSTGSDFYYFRDNGATYAIERLVYSGGTWNLQSKLSTNKVNNGIYSPLESAGGKVYGSSTPNEKLYVYDVSANTYTEFGSHRGVNFEVREAWVYYQIATSGKPSTLMSGALTPLPGDDFTIPTGSTIGDKFLLSFDLANSKIFILLATSGLLTLYSPTISMFIETEVNGGGKSLIDIVKDITVGYLLRARVSTIKQCHVLRRIDQSGNIITSGNVVTLNADRIKDFDENNAADVSDVVEVSNQDDTTNYDGSNYNVACIDNERIYPLSNNYIPSRLLKDYAYWIYQYMHHVRNKYRLETPPLPFFQYEPFDGASLEFSGKIVVGKSGIILGQTMTKFGKTEFEVEVFA
jgi:hypothetical protein